ncbi:MAG: DUF4326 domain-containing protein [Propionicimonas sp.]
MTNTTAVDSSPITWQDFGICPCSQPGAAHTPESHHQPATPHAPKRIQRQRTKGWRLPPNTIYVGRPTRYGNPYPVGVLLTTPTLNGQVTFKGDAATVAYMFRVWAENDTNDPGDHTAQHAALRAALTAGLLRGHDLACWCPLVDPAGNRVPCHADVLLDLANQPRQVTS